MHVTPWANRITRYGEEAPDQLLANPQNWRCHPKRQQDALLAALRKVGIVAPIIVNERTGFVVDGHLRVALAISDGLASIPIAYVDLTDDEEALILATFDPITGLATADVALLRSLTEDLDFGSDVLARLVADVLGDPGPDLDDDPPSTQDPNALQWGYTGFGTKRVKCASAEVDRLTELWQSYVDDNGNDVGFVRWLADGRA